MPNYLFSRILTEISYPLLASMERRRFWMINALFPKSPDGKSLKKAIDIAKKQEKEIIDLGSGKPAQAILDLRNKGIKNLNAMDIKKPRKIKGVDSIKGDIRDIPLEDGSIDGVIFSAYVVPHLKFEDQIKALEEIDRVAGPGSRGYIGPLNPQIFNKENYKGKYSEFKNPFFGFVKEKDARRDEKWELKYGILTNLSVYNPNRNINSLIYRLPIPLYNWYFLTGRSVLNGIFPKFKVKKDSKARLPFEYYITFTKKA